VTELVTLNAPLNGASENAAAVYIASLGSDVSRRTAVSSLRRAALLLTGAADADPLALDWTALRYAHMAALRAQLVVHYAPSTCNRILSVVKGVVRTAYRLGQIDGDAFQRIVMVESVSGERLPAGRVLDPDEIARLVAVCRDENTARGARDAALLALLFAGGLRRAEAAALELADVDAATGRLLIRRGKGNKARTVYLSGGALAALRAWLKLRPDGAGALIVHIHKSGAPTLRGISTTAIYAIIVMRAQQAGLPPTTPHDLRRTFVTLMLERGADVLAVRRLAGHSSVQTTGRYDRRGETAAAAAAALIDFPY
jgi:integrase/recombinase XerD